MHLSGIILDANTEPRLWCCCRYGLTKTTDQRTTNGRFTTVVPENVSWIVHCRPAERSHSSGQRIGIGTLSLVSHHVVALVSQRVQVNA